MSIVTKAASKLKFQTGDVPTQADFEDLHDSVPFLNQENTFTDKQSVQSATLGEGVHMLSPDGTVSLKMAMNASGFGFPELTSSGRLDIIASGIFLRGADIHMDGNPVIDRSGDSNGTTAGQKGSKGLVFEGHVYTGSGNAYTYSGWKLVPSTTVNALTRMVLYMNSSIPEIGDGTEVISVFSDTTVKINGAFPTLVKGLSATVTNATTSYADVTGLSFPVVSGYGYEFEFFIVYTANATGTGSAWSINGPTTTMLFYESEYTLTTSTTTLNRAQTGYNAPAAANATSGYTTAQNVAKIKGIIRPSANGTVIARFISEVAVASAIVAQPGSYVKYTQTY